MPVSLLNVGDHFSLEFDAADLDAVQSCIRARYGEMGTKVAGIVTIVTFGGEDFTFQNEWDDPCLISHSVEGDDLLQAIHANFRAS